MQRNYARERARHEAIAPEKQRAIYELLIAQLPDREQVLLGQHAILGFLTTRLCLMRPRRLFPHVAHGAQMDAR